MTLGEMLEEVGELDPKKHKGFVIGNGRKIYWYLTPTKNGYYRVLRIEDGLLCGQRYIHSETKVKIIYSG